MTSFADALCGVLREDGKEHLIEELEAALPDGWGSVPSDVLGMGDFGLREEVAASLAKLVRIKTCLFQSPTDYYYSNAEQLGTGQLEAPAADATILEVEVAIAGGGLGGLMLCAALQEEGIDAHVFERASALRNESQGMFVLWQNGQDALRLGLPSAYKLFKEVGQPDIPTRMEVRQPDGTVSEKEVPMSNSSVLGIQWTRAQNVFASLVPPGAVHCACAASYYKEEDNSVIVYFQGAAPFCVRARAVIAADGAFSALRRSMAAKESEEQVDPYADAPVFFGQKNWTAIAETSLLRKPQSCQPNEIRHITVVDPKMAIFVNDVGHGQTFWQMRFESWDFDTRGQLANEKLKQAALGSLRGECSDAGEEGKAWTPGREELLAEFIRLLEDTPAECIFQRGIFARQPIVRWRSGGGLVALLGDAAHAPHPVLGQGANQTFEDVCVLRHVLQEAKAAATTPHSLCWRSILKEYCDRRQPRATPVQVLSNLVGLQQVAPGKLRQQTATESISSAGAVMKLVASASYKAWLYDFQPGLPAPFPVQSELDSLLSGASCE